MSVDMLFEGYIILKYDFFKGFVMYNTEILFLGNGRLRA